MSRPHWDSLNAVRATLLATLAVVALLAAAPLAAQVPGELRGIVTDRESGRPIPGARIDVVGSGERGESAADGRYVVRGLAPQSYRVQVRAIGFAPAEFDAEIVNGRATTQDVSLLHGPSSLAALDTVRVSDRAAAAPGTTFDRAAIAASGKADVGELLQTAPTVVVTRMGGPGSAEEVSIRGSSPSEVLVLVDGVPINSPITGIADLSHLSLASVERITVLPGAQSSIYGARALAGVVIVETRSARRDLSLGMRSGAWGERDADLSAGDTWRSADRQAGITASGDRRTVRGDFAYDVPAVRGGGTATRENADVESSDADVAASLTTDASDARLRLDWAHTTRGSPGSIVQPSLTGRDRDDRVALASDNRWTIGAMALRASADLDRENAHFVDPSPPFGVAYDDSVLATQLRVAASGTIGGGAWTLSSGADARTTSLSTSMLDSAAPSPRYAGVWASGHTSNALAAATELSLDANLRGDWDSLLRGAVLSPRATATLTHGSAFLSASVGNGYSPPSLADQFFQEGVQVRPNPGLQPERVIGEVEVRTGVTRLHLPFADVSADIAAFRSNVRGMIIWQPDFRFVWSPDNFDVHRAGGESTVRLAAAGGVDLQGTLNIDAVTYAGPVLGGQVAYRPRTSGNVTAGLTRSFARLELTTRYVGARRTTAGSGLNLLDPYWLTDARVVVPIRRGPWTIEADAGVENAFNRPAAMLVDYPFGGRRWLLGLRVRPDSPLAPRQ